MNIAAMLPEPLNTFQVDIPAETYYDFGLEPGSSYPLKGVTYPVDYGNIPGHIAEDGDELDLFVGNQIDGEHGVIKVYRGQTTSNEHKYYVGLSKSQLDSVLEELSPVLLEHKSIADMTSLLSEIGKYKLHG